MAGRLLGMVAERIAALLRRIARAINRSQDDREVDAATDALRARFPGAPDHWLRYIAARAPALGGSGAVDVEARIPPRSERRAPASHPWLQDTDSRRAVALNLVRDAVKTDPRHRDAPSFPAPDQAARQGAVRLREWMRPKFRIVRSELSNRDTASRQARDSAERSATRVGTSETGPRESFAQSPAQPVQRVRFTASPAWTRHDLDSRSSYGRADVFSWFAFSWPHRAQKKAEQAAPRRELEKRDADPTPRHWSEPSHAAPGSLFLDSAAAPRHVSRFEQMFGATARSNAADSRWPAEDVRSPWPELPPPADDAEPMPATPPDFTRLRAEQDHGSWRG